jgi:hypothetical protein
MSILDETNSSFYSDGIYASRSLLNEHFNLTFSNVTKYTDHDYKADGDYAVDIYISNSDVIYLTFKEMISLNDGILVSVFDHPLINKYLADMNGLFCIFDAVRFTTDEKKFFYPVIENLKPSIVFKYSILNREMTISVQLLNTIQKDGESICTITKNTIIQNTYEPAKFDHVYGLKSPFYHSDLLIYKERILKVWGISPDSPTIDYKQMGQLTDMIHI